MSESKNETTKTNLIIVPASWVTYEVEQDLLDEVQANYEAARLVGGPSVAVMEALVMVGKAKRVAAVHTFNAVNVPDEDEEGDSPFYKGDEDDS